MQGSSLDDDNAKQQSLVLHLLPPSFVPRRGQFTFLGLRFVRAPRKSDSGSLPHLPALGGAHQRPLEHSSLKPSAVPPATSRKHGFSSQPF